MNYLTLLFISLFSLTYCQTPHDQTNSTNAYMIIDPKVMSKDIIQAFEFLTESKKIIQVTLKNEESLTHIKKVHALDGGYLMVFTLKSLKGDQFKIVPLTNIVSINAT